MKILAAIIVIILLSGFAVFVVATLLEMLGDAEKSLR